MKKIDKVIEVQMMEFAESARKALGAKACVVMVAFEGNQSASACDLEQKDVDHLYQAMRAIASGSDSVIQSMTKGKMRLLIELEGQAPEAVGKAFGVNRRETKEDPRRDF